ncbi:MAG: 3-phosphoshikimate 1-carboxyvinyltransferase [Clostridiales bacterium]|jgi:3-phosphoshikimate 1-carboxyvinyltransferase|nr:3-phosphoshikimate 1-carboxyvinyltransferase [Clostridiales bacterium]
MKGGNNMLIKPIKRIKQNITIPGDKSISHRAVMLSSIAEGESKIHNFLMGDDCLNTVECFRKMQVPIEITANEVKIKGVGLRGLKKPNRVLDVGNSGTTIRLMCGILAGQDFDCVITGDNSIQNRPMDRIIIPLRQMGSIIEGTERRDHAPLKIQKSELAAIDYNMPVASAQVKSAILLASIYADGTTSVTEIQKSRDHTERMLNYIGADIKQEGLSIFSNPRGKLYAKEIHVPGDISSAAFFLVLGAVAKDAEIMIEGVGLNPTRTGIVDVLKRMGANIKILNKRVLNNEPIGDIHIVGSDLRGTEISGDIIPRLIDEIPVIAVAAALAKGTTTIRNAEELKIKESNRIVAMVTELKKIGADIEETDDGMIIRGKDALQGGTVESYNDHRIAMALAIAGLLSKEGVIINNPHCVDISFPDFFDILDRMIKDES